MNAKSVFEREHETEMEILEVVDSTVLPFFAFAPRFSLSSLNRLFIFR